MNEKSCSTTQEKTGSCSSCNTGFNYCFWAKTLVAIPAIPMVAILSAAMFESVTAQLIAAGVSVFVLVWAAVKIDQLKIFSGMVVKRKA